MTTPPLDSRVAAFESVVESVTAWKNGGPEHQEEMGGNLIDSPAKLIESVRSGLEGAYPEIVSSVERAEEAARKAALENGVLRGELAGGSGPASGAGMVGLSDLLDYPINTAGYAVQIQNVRSISQLRRTIPLSSGGVAQVVGYYDGSTVGGGAFAWDAENVAPDNGADIIAVAGVDIGRWVFSGDFSAWRCGLVDSALTDNSPAVGLALSVSARTGATAIFPSTIIYCHGQIEIPKSGIPNIEFQNTRFRFTFDAPASDYLSQFVGAFYHAGSDGLIEVPISADIAIGQLSISVPAGALTTGDWFILKQDAISNATTADDGMLRRRWTDNMFRAESVSGTTVNLNYPSPHPYDTALNARVVRVDVASGCVMTGAVSIDLLSRKDRVNHLFFDRSVGVDTTGLNANFSGGGGRGAYIGAVANSDFGWFSRSSPTIVDSGNGYVSSFVGANNCTVERLAGDRCRHVFDASKGSNFIRAREVIGRRAASSDSATALGHGMNSVNITIDSIDHTGPGESLTIGNYSFCSDNAWRVGRIRCQSANTAVQICNGSRDIHIESIEDLQCSTGLNFNYTTTITRKITIGSYTSIGCAGRSVNMLAKDVEFGRLRLVGGTGEQAIVMRNGAQGLVIGRIDSRESTVTGQVILAEANSGMPISLEIKGGYLHHPVEAINVTGLSGTSGTGVKIGQGTDINGRVLIRSMSDIDISGCTINGEVTYPGAPGGTNYRFVGNRGRITGERPAASTTVLEQGNIILP